MALSLHPLVRRISQGEGLSLDFKKTISSAEKIARTLVAFANTEGGSLLIGVRDNGTVSGVKNQEEIYMIDTAASLFCQPAVPFVLALHDYKGLEVLEVKIPKSRNAPHRAKTEDGKWRAYVRIDDKTVLASGVMYEVLLRQADNKPNALSFTHLEEGLMAYLRKVGQATFDEIRDMLQLPAKRVVPILAGLICSGVMRANYSRQAEFYTLV